MKVKILDQKNKFTKIEKQFYRRIIKECVNEMGEGKEWNNSSEVFKVILTKSKRRYIGGWAFYNKPFMSLKLPFGIVCHNELVHTIRHEIYHTHGLTHKDMSLEAMRTCCCRKGNSPYIKFYQPDKKEITK